MCSSPSLLLLFRLRYLKLSSMLTFDSICLYKLDGLCLRSGSFGAVDVLYTIIMHLYGLKRDNGIMTIEDAVCFLYNERQDEIIKRVSNELCFSRYYSFSVFQPVLLFKFLKSLCGFFGSSFTVSSFDDAYTCFINRRFYNSQLDLF